MLTEKAKIDFQQWYYLNIGVKISVGHLSLYTLHETMINSVIIDFFDSVGIYISINKMELLNGFSYTILNNKTGFGSKENTRAEAITSAITKANEIYNNL